MTHAEASRLCVRMLAIPQVILAVLALTNFHVQIINRVSSGYPVWYLMVASAFAGAGPIQQIQTSRKSSAIWVVRWMIIYAIIHAGLFASFLPPA